MNPQLLAALNEQMNMEFLSERIYFSIAAHFDGWNLDGFREHMLSQANEERTHALKFFNFILDRFQKPTLNALEAADKDPKTVMDALRVVFEHEQRVTERIWQLRDLAMSVNDHATCVFLQWYISEQIEEERTAEHWYSLAKSVNNDPSAILILDERISK